LEEIEPIFEGADFVFHLAAIPAVQYSIDHPKETAEITKTQLEREGIKHVKIIMHNAIGEIIPDHYEIKIGKDSIVFIYKPIACHSYNVLNIAKQKVRIATIDTMLSFYLAFLYTDRPYYNDFLDRTLCMAKFLFDVQQKNRLEQKGLLRRFSITCYGHQESIEEMRADKAKKYREIKNNGDKKELEEWFLNYKPDENKLGEKKPYEKKSKKRGKESKTKKNKKNKLFGIYGGTMRNK